MGVCKDIVYMNLDKIGDNNYSVKERGQVEVLEDTSLAINQRKSWKSNVNSVSAMVELIDAHRRFDQSQKAIQSIDQNKWINNW